LIYFADCEARGSKVIKMGKAPLKTAENIKNLLQQPHTNGSCLLDLVLFSGGWVLDDATEQET